MAWYSVLNSVIGTVVGANARSAVHNADMRQLRGAINWSKVRCSKDLCDDVNNDHGGGLQTCN